MSIFALAIGNVDASSGMSFSACKGHDRLAGHALGGRAWMHLLLGVFVRKHAELLRGLQLLHGALHHRNGQGAIGVCIHTLLNHNAGNLMEQFPDMLCALFLRHLHLAVLKDLPGVAFSGEGWLHTAEPARRTSRQTLTSSSIPNAFTRSAFLANSPWETFTNTLSVCNTSSMSFSLPRPKGC